MWLPDLIVIDRGSFRRFRQDDTAAAELLLRRASSTALLLELSSDAMRMRPGAERFEELVRRVSGSEAVVAEQTVPFLPHAGANNDRVLVVRIVAQQRVVLVSIEEIGALSSPWAMSIAQATAETVLSAAQRTAQLVHARGMWPAFSSTLSDELAQLNALLLSRTVDDIAMTARQTFKDSEEHSVNRRAAFEQILDTRSRLHEVIAHLHGAGLHDTPVMEELRNGVSACDALTTSLVGIAAIVMQEQANLRESREKTRDGAAIKRDRQLARIASALLLPGLWFAFLGSNVLPEKMFGWEVQSSEATIVAALVGVILAVAGWFLIPLFVLRPRSEKNK